MRGLSTAKLEVAACYGRRAAVACSALRWLAARLTTSDDAHRLRDTVHRAIENLLEDLVTARRETVDARRLRALRLRRAQPTAFRHSRQHRIERPRTQAIAVVVQFFEHPMSVDALFGGVVKDVDLPEGEQELANDWIAHDGMITLPIRNRFSITWHEAARRRERRSRIGPCESDTVWSGSSPRRRLPPINGYRNLIPISKLERRRHPSESDHKPGPQPYGEDRWRMYPTPRRPLRRSRPEGIPCPSRRAWRSICGERRRVVRSRSTPPNSASPLNTNSFPRSPASHSVTSQILLSGPQASGSRPMPNGQQQEPGGWNRVVLRVTDLPAFIDTLKKAGLHFRNDMETGPGGKQIQVEDPDGNPIELFQPAR